MLSLPGLAMNKSGLPAARKLFKTGRRCCGLAVRVACLPYTAPLACVRVVHRTACSIAEHSIDTVCSFVPDVLLEERGDVLADLSQADLEEAYVQAGISFQACKLSVGELRHQVRIAKEHGSQQERLLTACQQSCCQLEQLLQGQAQQLLEQQQRAEQGQIQSLQDQRGNLEGQVTDLTGQNEDLTVQAAKAAAAHKVEQQRLEEEVSRLRGDKASLLNQAQRVPDLEEQLKATSLANAEASQAHEEQVHQLKRDLSRQSDRMNKLVGEVCELRRQAYDHSLHLSSLRTALANEEASHTQARLDLQSKHEEMSEVQQHLASVQQHSSVLEAEAIRRAEELNATKLMLQDVTATAQQAQQEAQDEHERLRHAVAEQQGKAAEV
ncbi:TPA: hypothetical protein ACH3X3_011799 [Trebouxia sp. C0006]